MNEALRRKTMALPVQDDHGFEAMRTVHTADEREVIAAMVSAAGITPDQRQRAHGRAVQLIERIRGAGKPGLMEMFLAEYGLSTNEGIALMCLAEALLRVPDPGTIDELIEDKIAPYDWSEHAGKSGSALVNASTIGLMMTGRILDEDNSASVSGLLNRTVKRLGEPVVRVAVRRAMREMGNQFVLGQTIEEALKRGAEEVARGFRYSYDMLGEAALTKADADAYFEAYSHAIRTIGKNAKGDAVAERPGISVKLSALHPRFELAKQERLSAELAPRLNELARLAKSLNLGLNVDAEESQRLEVSLQVIRDAITDPELAGWDGFGVVVQAYQKRAAPVLDWLYGLASRLDRRIMVRLVKGAYWDSELKQSQVDGTEDYPVFTRRAATDVSYLCCAAKLLRMTDRIYPQFATHNAQTAATILELAAGRDDYEFQRLHGMGETLYHRLLEDGARCRIYAPVGPHKDLLAYLVRRLLENGANSSFVNKIVDPTITPAALAADPFESVAALRSPRPKALADPSDIFAPGRKASRGWDLANSAVLREIDRQRLPFHTQQWHVTPLVAGSYEGAGERTLVNPARPDDTVGTALEASAEDVRSAIANAKRWDDVGVAQRAFVLRSAADLYENDAGELLGLLAREAGKGLPDAIAEIREAVDFLRYYAGRAEALGDNTARGVFACISPWNFPLAIFTGQIAAALAAGNAVVAKPAEATPLIAHAAVRLLHAAGVPRETLQLLPGDGPSVGSVLASDPRIGGVCFTGSTATAQRINQAMADKLSPAAPLIAETGGLNAGIVDSTALPEQAVRDVIASSFQSAGQRCSALRVLYLQEDVADVLLEMLFGAMDELSLGDPWALKTDIGPVISEDARAKIQGHVDRARDEGRLLKQLATPDDGYFVGPAVIEIGGIGELEEEIFGPVLHIVRFAADDFDKVIGDINATGYGLTFGLHTRIDDRVKSLSGAIHVGNVYINRNQIGAVVESQPFGGEGLSGTGPKAGGPNYLRRFIAPPAAPSAPGEDTGAARVDAGTVQKMIDAMDRPEPEPLEIHDMPGPTGESNTLAIWPRGLVLCLGPTLREATLQAGTARRMGCSALIVAPGAGAEAGIDGTLDLDALATLRGIAVVALWGDADAQRRARQVLASRDGPILPLVTQQDLESYCVHERHTCINTTAAGGNASLLATTDD
jgi:RHH-type proline utilization regulon transcriptional repressor/proline dehydrogenase/delta 1-pyrroline-5-carboxylate dehydrogenase